LSRARNFAISLGSRAKIKYQFNKIVGWVERTSTQLGRYFIKHQIP